MKPDSMNFWRGKRVFLTGASSGIGEALAVALAERGAELVLASRRQEALEAVRARCEAPERHHVVILDLAEPRLAAEAAAAAEREHGAIDVVINNGGISQRGHAAETDYAVDERIMTVDFLGTIAVTKALVPGMLERGSGRVVVVSSIVGRAPTPMRSAYSAAKHALHGWFDALRAETADRGLVVTLVCPGFVRTQVSVNALEPDGSAHGEMDSELASGMSAERCAGKILHAVERGRAEVVIARYEGVAVFLNRHFPSLWRYVMRRMARR
jgi:short-subunit dehydrogenase